MKKTNIIVFLLLTIGVVLNGMWYEICDMFYPTQCDPNNGNVPTLMVDGTGALLEAHLHFTAAVNLVQQGKIHVGVLLFYFFKNCDFKDLFQ